MKPKEKAKELYQKFLPQCLGYNGFFNSSNPTEDHSGKAKLCAIICVDEIINTLVWNETKKIRFWEEVKQEIKNL